MKSAFSESHEKAISLIRTFHKVIAENKTFYEIVGYKIATHLSTLDLHIMFRNVPSQYSKCPQKVRDELHS